MMPRGQPLLHPVNPGFIALTLLCALMLNALPWGDWVFVPDFLALTLVFWNIHQPRRVGIGVAWMMGLLMDVHDASLLGEHALAYSLLSYGAITLHRRVPWFGMGGQMAHVFPLFLVAQISVLIVRLSMGGTFPGFLWFAQSLSATLMWPLAHWLLLAPQRQRPDERTPEAPR